jgi:hypothetical protein
MRENSIFLTKMDSSRSNYRITSTGFLAYKMVLSKWPQLTLQYISMNKQNIFEGRRQILLFSCGP